MSFLITSVGTICVTKQNLQSAQQAWTLGKWGKPVCYSNGGQASPLPLTQWGIFLLFFLHRCLCHQPCCHCHHGHKTLKSSNSPFLKLNQLQRSATDTNVRQDSESCQLHSFQNLPSPSAPVSFLKLPFPWTPPSFLNLPSSLENPVSVSLPFPRTPVYLNIISQTPSYSLRLLSPPYPCQATNSNPLQVIH